MAAPIAEPYLTARERPEGTPVLYQRWANLLFLHWRWDPADVQATLPSGLQVDTFDGEAWLGVVPFWMQAVRPRGLPPLPGLSWFMELNLRTYVRDKSGRPGVWFYSLDCNQPLAVTLARTLFGLNYVHARQFGHAPSSDSTADFQSRRRSTGGTSHFNWRPTGPRRRAEAGSLEWFLVERYLLFSKPRGELRTGRVWHEPYPICEVTDLHAETALWHDQKFLPPNRPPDHTLCSPGVSVSIYPLRD